MRRRGLLALGLAGLASSCGNTKMKARDFFADPGVAELADAADRGDIRALDRAVASGASPNAEGKDGITPLLFVLASSRNKNGLRALLRAGADPNRFAPNGFCPLVLSARAKDPEFLTIMLDGGGNPNLKNPAHEPVIQVTALDERWDNLQQLIRKGADINSTDGGGYTLAMNLAIARKYDQLYALLQQGADAKVVARNKDSLGAIVSRVTVRPDSPQSPWREKVIALLRNRGVAIPTRVTPK